MKEFNYIINDELGIHARPAGQLVKATSKYECSIKAQKGEKEVDAKSILGIMGLGVKKGEEIIFRFEGTDEAEASEAISVFLKETL